MLYRGVRSELHLELKGQIKPRGEAIEVVPRFDGTWCFDGTFTFGHSEANAVRAHHIQNGKWGGCFVSTSRSYRVAKYFATSDEYRRRFDGFVYHLDESLFDQYGVVSHEFGDPLYPDEKEVSIRAVNGGEIPAEVIVRVEEVSISTGYSRLV